MIIDELYIGDEVQVETGFTNWDRSDNEFYCTVAGKSENGMVILDARNAVSFDGRNKIQPYFVVDKRADVEECAGCRKIPGCYVLWDIVGMDDCGRFILRTNRGMKSNINAMTAICLTSNLRVRELEADVKAVSSAADKLEKRIAIIN